MSDFDLLNIVANNDFGAIDQYINERLEQRFQQQEAERQHIAQVLAEFPDLVNQDSDLARATKEEMAKLETRAMPDFARLEIAASRASLRVGRSAAESSPKQPPAPAAGVVDDSLRRMAQRMNNGQPVPDNLLKETLKKLDRR